MEDKKIFRKNISPWTLGGKNVIGEDKERGQNVPLVDVLPKGGQLCSIGKVSDFCSY